MVAKSALVIKPLRVSAGEYSAVAIQLAWFDTERKAKAQEQEFRCTRPFGSWLWDTTTKQQAKWVEWGKGSPFPSLGLMAV